MTDDALVSSEPEDGFPFFGLEVKNVNFTDALRLICHPQQVLPVEVKGDTVLVELD